jgi:anhydro-N-acetylmuramic acid kinase
LLSQINRHLPDNSGSKVLFTGGGSHNKYLLELLRATTACNIIVPPSRIVDYKEALIFALLGVLRFEGMTNCYASATGAKYDCSSGALHLPPKIPQRK